MRTFLKALLTPRSPNNRERMLERMTLVKDEARAKQYAGDPFKPHDEPKRVRPLGFLDELDDANQP